VRSARRARRATGSAGMSSLKVCRRTARKYQETGRPPGTLVGPAKAGPDKHPYFFPMSVKPAAGPNSVAIGPSDILWPPGIVTVRPATMPSAAPNATSLK